MRRVRSVSNTVDAVRRLESPAFRRGEYQGCLKERARETKSGERCFFARSDL